MKHSDGYKRVEEEIKHLEQQLTLCDQTISECEQSGKDAETQIEEHFAKCINALNERKITLLRETSQRVANQRMVIAETRVKMEASIEVCKQTLKAGAMMSPCAAETICKRFVSIPSSRVCCVRVITKLPQTLFDDIQKHGEVGDTSRFSKVEMITTLAGSSQGQKDGKGINACLKFPWGMCFNPRDECFYICDYGNNAIRKLTFQGDVTTFATSDTGVKSACGIVMNYKQDCYYVANYCAHTIVKITSSGVLSPFVGSGQRGNADGVGTNASFNYLCDIAIDQQTGNLFVTDFNNHLIRKVTPQGGVSTLAGSQHGFADGNGKAAKFNYPYGICYDENSQSLLVCDYNNHKIRRVQLNGDVSTLCDIQSPTSVAITANQIILVATDTHTLHKVTYKGSQKYTVEALAGSGRAVRRDGRGQECCFANPHAIVVHEASHSCFIADYSNHAIKRISFATANQI